MKVQIDIVFVVLVYRNHTDLEEFINSVDKQCHNKKIIVVNSYYDEYTCKKIESIASHHDCDFINIDNKGYSFGNNRGIEYAVQHYSFNYLIVSNPDIIVKRLPQDQLKYYGDIIAPRIIAASGKNQNPMVITENKLSERLIYLGFRYKRKVFLLCGIGINKVLRELFVRIKRKQKCTTIYEAHGSFVIFSYKAIQKFNSAPYDENMFLFAEESVLALKAKRLNLKINYVPEIDIYHKEDGSMKLGDVSVNNELAKSNIYFYEEYRLKRKM